MELLKNMVGFQFPFELDGSRGEIKLADYARDIRDAVHIILTTEKGERPMRPNFGTRLNRFAFERMDNTTRNLIRQEIISSLLEWENRIENITVEFESKEREGILLVDVGYRVRQNGDADKVTIPIRTD